jgi:AcrR family transcriptional regulator
MGIKERREREKKIREKEIQAAAKEVFLEKGFRATTMEDIAKKAELSPATIYLYFKSKDELYVSLTLDVAQFLQKEIEKVSNNKKMKVENKLFSLKSALLKTYHYDPLMFRNVMHIQAEGTLSMISEDLLTRMQNITRQCSKGVASILEQGIKEGKFINENLMAQVDMIWGLFTGIVLWEDSKKTLNPKKDHLKTTLDLAFKILHLGITRKTQSK